MLGWLVVLNTSIGLWKIGTVLFGLMRLLLFYFIDSENTESVYARYSHCWSLNPWLYIEKSSPLFSTLYAFYHLHIHLK